MTAAPPSLDDVLGKYVKKPEKAGKPHLVLLYSSPGGGKGLLHGTPVATPDGWTPVENLHVGDEVIGSDGTPTRVYGLWHRGTLPVYTVTFSDGSNVSVDGDHLWTVRNRYYGHPVTLPTRILAEKLSSTHPKFYEIPRVSPVQYTGSDLPIQPYFLGALIADGYLSGEALQWTKNNQSVVDEVLRNADGWSIREVTRDSSTARQWHVDYRLKDILDGLGLRVKSRQKRIPSSYLTASEDDRRSLLAGLFDGDGSVRSERGLAQYHSMSEGLVDDVLQLCWSLGIAAQKGGPKPDGTWFVSILDGTDPFRASEHVGRVESGNHIYSRRRIVSIEPSGVGEVTCLAVEAGDQLYVTKDYIVTHNTHLAATASELPGVKKVLYIDIEGSTVGTLSDFDADKIDVLEVYNMTSPDPEKSNSDYRFEFLTTVLARLVDEGTTYDAVVIDTLDVAQDWAIDYYDRRAPVTRSGEKDGYWTWGEVKKWTVSHAQSLKALDALVVLVMHDREEKDSGGGIVTKLRLSGSAKDVLPGIPDVVAYLERRVDDEDGKVHTTAYFETSDTRVTKNRFKFPAAVRDVTFPKLWNYIDSQHTSTTKEK